MDKPRIRNEIIQDTVENHEGCWLWLKSAFVSGYGQKKVSGKNWRVHKLSYLVFNGKIPKNKIVRHRCGNRRCCNPIHLEIGSLKENSQDMINHGRSHFHNVSQSGKNNPRAKLDEDLVYNIRLEYLNGLTMQVIADKLLISRKTIERAIRGKSYSEFKKIPPIPSKR